MMKKKLKIAHMTNFQWYQCAMLMTYLHLMTKTVLHMIHAIIIAHINMITQNVQIQMNHVHLSIHLMNSLS